MDERKDIKEMTDREIAEESLIHLRNLDSILQALSESPMARMAGITVGR